MSLWILSSTKHICGFLDIEHGHGYISLGFWNEQIREVSIS